MKVGPTVTKKGTKQKKKKNTLENKSSNRKLDDATERKWH